MKRGKVRRFSGFQVVLHWCVAIPYLVLFVTGGTILLQRLFHTDVFPQHVLDTAHRWTGVAMIALLAQMLVAMLWTGQVKSVRRDLVECLLIGPRDMLWLVKAPLSVMWPRIELPRAGRFNAGQKLHVIAICIGVPAFAVTGLVMMWRPGVLAAWIVHAALLVLATPFCRCICSWASSTLQRARLWWASSPATFHESMHNNTTRPGSARGTARHTVLSCRGGHWRECWRWPWRPWRRRRGHTGRAG